LSVRRPFLSSLLFCFFLLLSSPGGQKWQHSHPTPFQQPSAFLK
jgi:hypothetical protein